MTPVTATATGGDGSYSYSVSPALPAGVQIDSATGTISGTPTVVPSPTSHTVTVTDGTGATAQAVIAVQVDPIPQGTVTLEVVSDGEAAARFRFSSATPALNLAVETINGFGRSEAIALAPGDYTVTVADMRGAGLVFSQVGCTAPGSAGSAETRTASFSLESGGEIICRFVAVDVAGPTEAAIGDFLEARTQILLSNLPDVGRRFDRLRGQTALSAPGTVLMGYLPALAANSGVAAAASLAQFEALAGNEQHPDFDLWTSLTLGRHGHGAQEGTFGLVALGADRLVTPDLLVGAFAQLDVMNAEQGAGGPFLSGTGWLAGPYVTARLSDNLYLDVLAAAGTSSNTINPFGTYTDDFETTRWLASATLEGAWTQGAWTFSPRARLAWAEEFSAVYTDSLGVAIASIRRGGGEVAAGPGIAYSFAAGDTVAASLGLRAEGVARFDAGSDPVFDGRLEASLDFSFDGGASLSFSAAQTGLTGNGPSATAATIGLNIPLR